MHNIETIRHSPTVHLYKHETFMPKAVFFYLQTLVEETSSSEVYKDTYSLLNEVSREVTSKTSVGVSLKFSATDSSTQSNQTKLSSLNTGLNTATETAEMIKTITDQSNTKVRCLSLKSCSLHI